MNILVVDDDLVSLQSVVEKVRANVELSDHVYGFTSPERMHEHAQGHLCDVFFLKIELPNISGLEVARRLKQIQPKVNVIFESNTDCYMRNAFDLRCSGYLMEPIQTSDIQGELQNLRFSQA